MSRRGITALAFAGGAPALVYQVAWTREVGLLAGGHVEALAVVIAAFFGGLAIGAHRLGRAADRAPNVMRFYAALEIGAAALAAASILPLRAVGDGWLGLESSAAQLAAAACTIVPVTFLLGGTLPALLRASGEIAARGAGQIVGANTAGAVLGVCGAVYAIPRIGLARTLFAASAIGVCVGLVALLLARGSRPAPAAQAHEPPAPRGVLWMATAAGIATLGYEVVAARLAALQLGSTLSAWGLVLGLTLLGLAAGNLACRDFAARSREPVRALAWLELAAAGLLIGGAALLRPDIARPASGFAATSLTAVLAGVLPPTFAMGAAFPLLVRLGVREPDVGAPFGRLSALNTAGGIVGALAIPWLALPWLGTFGAALACAAINAAIGIALHVQRGSLRARAAACGGALAFAAAALLATRVEPPSSDAWPLYVADGAQVTAVVTTTRGRRDLLVDGDPEASTGGNARVTERLLAALPLLIHPAPRDFMEVGLGSGITLATARRFPLASVGCVELADTVVRASPFFEPDAEGVASRPDVRIERADARVFLRRRSQAFDVVAANTLHPWSLGATGLYSREYFTRLAGALRSDGIAVQWVPATDIDPETFALIVRTFFDRFAEGSLWWGAENVVLLGSADPLPQLDPAAAERRLVAAGLAPRELGVSDLAELGERRIADAAAARRVLGAQPLLTDDLPLLELTTARRDPRAGAGVFALLVEIAGAERAELAAASGLRLWLESRAARASGDAQRADGREQLAIDAGFAEAGRDRGRRLASDGYRSLEAGNPDAGATFERALASDPAQRDARYGLAGFEIGRRNLGAAASHLETLLADRPEDPEAWNELGGVRFRQGDLAGAEAAFARALIANPFYPAALANAGQTALARGRTSAAWAALEQLRALGVVGRSPEEVALARALDARGGGD